MTAGVGLFGIFTGFVASLFVEPELKQEENEIQQLTREVQALSAQVQLLQTKLNNQGPKSFEGDS
jgi:cell division protein FtsB